MALVCRGTPKLAEHSPSAPRCSWAHLPYGACLGPQQTMRVRFYWKAGEAQATVERGTAQSVAMASALGAVLTGCRRCRRIPAGLRVGRASLAGPWSVPLPSAAAGRPYLVLGLDGVLCTGVREAAVAASEAASALWPSVLEVAQEIELGEAGVRRSWVSYDWKEYLAEPEPGLGAADMRPTPGWLVQKVAQLRSVCDGEWELVLLARLCVEEAAVCRANRAMGRRGARPLTVGEIEASWTDDDGLGLRESLLVRWGCERGELEEALAQARRQRGDEWTRGAHGSRVHLDVAGVVHAAVACRAAAESVHVLTSRDQRSAALALQAVGEALRREVGWEKVASSPDFQGSWNGKDGWRLVCGLGTVEAKADAVQTICSTAAGSCSASMHVVDDSVGFLRACSSRLSLGLARFHLASWGHVSPGRWAALRGALPRVGELSGAQQLAQALGGGLRGSPA